MDVFSHGLWSAVIFKAVNNRQKTAFKIKEAAFWGVFPDIFAFIIPFVGMFWLWLLGDFDFRNMPRPNDIEPPQQNILWTFKIAEILYNYSHSLIIFSLIFGIVYFIFKKPSYEMLAWLLHIFIDIPTHSYKFYPTPFLWPISSLKVDGFSWAHSWFLIVNYSALIIFYFLSRGKAKEK